MAFERMNNIIFGRSFYEKKKHTPNLLLETRLPKMQTVDGWKLESEIRTSTSLCLLFVQHLNFFFFFLFLLIWSAFTRGHVIIAAHFMLFVEDDNFSNDFEPQKDLCDCLPCDWSKYFSNELVNETLNEFRNSRERLCRMAHAYVIFLFKTDVKLRFSIGACFRSFSFRL